ncbi:YMGG-like glycine zipper-containing protein [Mesorhizobium sp. dw_380]|uniref:YMGG-like glycine zipper-containing protein n=1 Tax=Mesorhizobium sp. dw_380 TaxID=2812001 RepID=UPI001BDEE6C5|nr:YMGG-like glycine zipper-containing protein [Mesorhizobium sp. dw_380]
MRKMIIAMVAVVAVSGCTSTEQDVVGGGLIGAGIGGLVGGGKGALIGAAVGAGSGLLVRKLQNGQCVYRDRRGTYTARCN